MNKTEHYFSKKNWDLTNKLFINWVSKNELKFFLAQNCLIDGLSVWWPSKIVSKDNVNDQKWFIDLKDTLINKNLKHKKINFFWIIFLVKFFKNLIKNFFWLILIKFISLSRYKNYNIKNCFHSFNYNFLRYENEFKDRLYGNLLSKVVKKNNFYLVTNIKKLFYLKNIFSFYFNQKKIAISDEFIPFKDLIRVNTILIYNLFKIVSFLNKNKKVFYINKIDCSAILKPLFFSSFCGELQESYLNAISLKNFLDKYKIKNFINYGEFSPGYRSNYFYIKKSLSKPKIITFQHGQGNFLYNFNKSSEFTNNVKKEGKLYSPSPDLYLVQGKNFSNILKKYFKKKIIIIGALKYDIVNFKKKINYRLKKIKSNTKKNILICPSIGDHVDILKILKESVDRRYNYILSPHPTYRKEIKKIYLGSNINFKYYDNEKTSDLIKISDLVIAGFSHTAIESQIIGVPSLRIIDLKKPIYIDYKDKIKIIYDKKELIRILKYGNFEKYKIKKINDVIKFYFNKLDHRSYKRFLNYVN